jgi:type I restriction enzyme, S subunit
MKLTSLSSVCEIIMGQAPPGETYNGEGIGLPLIAGASDLGEVTPKPSRFTSGPTKISRAGDIILCIRATIGDLNWSEREYCLGRGVAALRANPGRADARYLWRVVEYRSDKLSALGRGATFKQVSRADIGGLEIPLPSLTEQRHIAAVLDLADELRRKRRLGFGQLDALTRSIFSDLFGDPTRDSGQWPQTTLERFFGFRTGKLDSNAAVPNGQFPFFTCAKEDFRIDTYAFDCEALLLAGNNANADYSVKHYKGKFNAYQRTYVLTLRNERNSYQYARFALEYRLAELKRISKGTNTKYLTLELLNNLRIPLPPPELQSKFANLSAGIENLKVAYSNHLRKLDTLFISLQHRAFSGELTAKDVERELAIAG